MPFTYNGCSLGISVKLPPSEISFNNSRVLSAIFVCSLLKGILFAFNIASPAVTYGLLPFGPCVGKGCLKLKPVSIRIPTIKTLSRNCGTPYSAKL